MPAASPSVLWDMIQTVEAKTEAGSAMVSSLDRRFTAHEEMCIGRHKLMDLKINVLIALAAAGVLGQIFGSSGGNVIARALASVGG